jgi:hypothetical protein
MEVVNTYLKLVSKLDLYKYILTILIIENTIYYFILILYNCIYYNEIKKYFKSNLALAKIIIDQDFESVP